LIICTKRFIVFIILENLDVPTLIEVLRLSKWLGIESNIEQVKNQLDTGLDQLRIDSSLRAALQCRESSNINPGYMKRLWFEGFVKIFILADVIGKKDVVEGCAQICIDYDICFENFVYIISLSEVSVMGKAYFAAYVLRDCKILFEKGNIWGIRCNCLKLQKMQETSQEMLVYIADHKNSRNGTIEVASEEDLKSIESLIEKIASKEQKVKSHLHTLYFQMKNRLPGCSTDIHCTGYLIAFCCLLFLAIFWFVRPLIVIAVCFAMLPIILISVDGLI